MIVFLASLFPSLSFLSFKGLMVLLTDFSIVETPYGHIIISEDSLRPYRYIGSFAITTPWYNDIILLLPWHIVISGLHSTDCIEAWLKMTPVVRTLAIPDTKRRPEGVRYKESWLYRVAGADCWLALELKRVKPTCILNLVCHVMFTRS